METNSKSLEQFATALALLLGKALGDVPEELMSKAMSVFPDIILAELLTMTETSKAA